MSMDRSFELGWIITDRGNSEVEDSIGFFEKLNNPLGNDEGYEVPGSGDLNRGEPLYFETHPEKINRVFVQMYDLEHGMTDFAEPPDLGGLVRTTVSQLGAYDVDWGIIETRR